MPALMSVLVPVLVKAYCKHWGVSHHTLPSSSCRRSVADSHAVCLEAGASLRGAHRRKQTKGDEQPTRVEKITKSPLQPGTVNALCEDALCKHDLCEDALCRDALGKDSGDLTM